MKNDLALLPAIFATTALLTFSNSVEAASSSWRCEFSGYKEPIIYIAELGTGKGKMVGNAGTADVWVVEGTSAISFLEPLATGAVQLTTIVIKSGEAAHSRNTVMSMDGASLEDGSAFMPSQAIGKCMPWN